MNITEKIKQSQELLLGNNVTLFSELNQNEIEELKACESVIEKNLQGFLEVGEALINIKKNKLYRATFKTFEEYCQQKWNFTSRYARNLIQSAELIDELKSGTIVPKILPITEGQAREVLKVDSKNRVDLLNSVAEAVETGEKLTANLVREKAEEYISDAKPIVDKKTPDLNKTINVVETDQIPGQLDLVEEINKTEVITIAPPSNEKKIIELEVPVKKTLPALRITQEIINRSLKVLGVSKADFAIQDHLTGPYIPASNQDNDFIDFNGRGIINLLTDENLFKYFADVMTNISIGNTFECIIFVKAIFNTSYFEAMLSYSEVWAGLKLNEPYPVAAFYFGPYPNKFTQEFQDVGLLMSKFLMQEAN